MYQNFNRYLKAFTFVVFLFVTVSLVAKPVKETVMYSVKNGVSLYLDKYRAPELPTEKQPCVVFMFGGGFRAGTRDGKAYINYFNYLAEHGYTVISIDYRLGLKNVKLQQPAEVIPSLKRAIDWAVEDLYDATSFIVQHANEWKIDPQQVIISGSSAGAVTVLQAEYERCNDGPLVGHLPRNFGYAGVIGFAGAILSFSNSLEWAKTPAPMILFHGDADGTVPFGKLSMENIMFCGSQEIKEQLSRRGTPYCLFQFTGAAHEISEEPFKNNLSEINRLLEIMVLKRMPVTIHTIVGTAGAKNQDKPLLLEDFLKENF